MRYNKLGATGISVSEVAMGSEGYEGRTREEIKALIDAALLSGINFFDLFNPNPEVRSAVGAALKGRRENAIIQGHVCTVWRDGQYARSRDIDACKASYEDLLTRLNTDYIDIGMIHFVDGVSDFNAVFGGPIMEYMLRLKSEGVVRHIGLSSHNPAVAGMAVETGLIEALMFSINPAFDMLPASEDIDALFDSKSYESGLSNIDPGRESLYNACESSGVGITVMTAVGGGYLLDEKRSPFGIALTPVECIHYALNRPAVASVFGGFKTAEEIAEASRYSDADRADKDYSGKLFGLPKYTFSGKCMYCGHCAPCSAGIDIAFVNKYLELAAAGEAVPETVRDHYMLLEHRAGECVQCGRCEENCPFGVEIMERMRRARAVFGE
jgi:predicted aldo/keto reductase-like oxidoreductase